MRSEDLMRIVTDPDPDLSDPDTARVLFQLARQAARSDEDIAGDVLVTLTEKLHEGGKLRGRWTSHADPPALLARAAANAARDAWDHASRFKRDLPLTPDGDLTALESPDLASSPSYGLLDLLEDLGWKAPGDARPAPQTTRTLRPPRHRRWPRTARVMLRHNQALPRMPHRGRPAARGPARTLVLAPPRPRPARMGMVRRPHRIRDDVAKQHRPLADPRPATPRPTGAKHGRDRPQMRVEP